MFNNNKKQKRHSMNGVLIRFLLASLLSFGGNLFTTTIYLSTEDGDAVIDRNVHNSIWLSGYENVPKTSTRRRIRQIPIVIVSSLRPWYLSQVLKSLIDQNPNTPEWILDSPRYLFAHKHRLNDIDDRWNATLQLATQYNLSVHTFDELYVGSQPPPNLTMAYHAKYTWYHMMEYLFHTLNNPNNVTEALVIEDDVVLAYDGLMVAAALFQEKSRRQQQRQNMTIISDPDPLVHNLVLGGWSGENRINAHPDTYLAARSINFQPMAYSMSRTLFDQIHREFLRNENVPPIIPDWSEEITRRQFLTNYTLLTPSVSRMHHIGVKGMGKDGNGSKDRPKFPRGWQPWKDTISDSNRMISDMHLDPPVSTDVFGFVCKPIQADCGMSQLFPVKKRFGASNVSRFSKN